MLKMYVSAINTHRKPIISDRTAEIVAELTVAATFLTFFGIGVADMISSMPTLF